MSSQGESVSSRVVRLVAERVPRREAVSGEAVIRELGLDSVAVMDLVMAVEDEFDMVFPLDRLGDVETVADLARVVQGIIEQRTTAS
ncbi:MAG TPA: acyl carrier protein [Candidatus Omnitrophota bacterium]|nr:acyl carrier protein [Candidatus Omnitrophota bacterium]